MFYACGRVLWYPNFARRAVGSIRQGIDALAVEGKTKKLRVIEFGTGRKPTLKNAKQLTPDWARKHLADLMKDPNKRIEIRDAGCPIELTYPEKLLDPKFPLDQYITREVFAPEIDKRLCEKIGAILTELL